MYVSSLENLNMIDLIESHTVSDYQFIKILMFSSRTRPIPYVSLYLSFLCVSYIDSTTSDNKIKET